MSAALSRRRLVGTGSLAGLAAVGTGGVSSQANAPKPESPFTPDHALLAACTTFEHAHDDQVRIFANPNLEDAEADVIEDAWYAAVDAILVAPAPRTNFGRVALARAARLAFIDQVSGGTSHQFGKSASREERLTLLALSAIAGA